MSKPTSLAIVGLHPIVASKESIEETRDLQWSDGLSGSALDQANANVREHFEKLYLVELVVEPSDAMIDWDVVAQPAPGLPRGNWQVPWDEQQIEKGRWVFWLHGVDLKQPLQTELGQAPLPAPSPMPDRLVSVKYELP